jgi:nucleotide-binding universal stress UspA family protein
LDRIVAFGRPAAGILRAARERKAGLIVMGTQGSRGPSNLVGSTAQRVIRAAPCPVLALRRA